MKRFLCAFLAVCFIMTVPLSANAATTSERAEILYNEDGSYIVVTLEDIPIRASGVLTRSKTYSYYNAADEIEWKAVLTGTFEYDGASATCIASACDVYIYNTNWYLISKNTTKSGNTVNSTVRMGRKVLGITVSQKDYYLTLSCDGNGNIY